MKIVHLLTHDTGGAARAALRLHEGLFTLGHDSQVLVKHRRRPDPHFLSVETPSGIRGRIVARFRSAWLQRKLDRYADSRAADLEIFSHAKSACPADLPRSLPPSDVYNLHWVASLLDYARHLPLMAARAPLVWTLHDMNPFTGGCHYALGCDRFLSNCGRCPQLGSQRDNDLSSENWRWKHRGLGDMPSNRLVVCAPSQWLAAEARRSSLLGRFRTVVVPYGIDANLFRPIGRSIARAALGIPPEARAIMFAADSITNPRKGMTYLCQALDRITHENDLLLLALGGGAYGLPLKTPILPLGHIDNDRCLALAYNAADVFVAPSIADNLPNTILEAMACGVPVVAFSSGGIVDLVRPYTTGLTVPPMAVDALAAAIMMILSDAALRGRMAQCCRSIIMNEYSLTIQAQRYQTIYEELLGLRHDSSAQI